MGDYGIEFLHNYNFPSSPPAVQFGTLNTPLHFSSESTKEFDFANYGAGMAIGTAEYAPYHIVGSFDPNWQIDYADLFDPNAE